jgi:hypothetical protein
VLIKILCVLDTKHCPHKDNLPGQVAIMSMNDATYTRARILLQMTSYMQKNTIKSGTIEKRQIFCFVLYLNLLYLQCKTEIYTQHIGDNNLCESKQFTALYTKDY